MKKENWNEDQPVLKSDLERVQDTKEDAIRERITDIFPDGVILGSQLAGESREFLIDAGVGLFITVNTGVAYIGGERIVIPSITSFDTSPGKTATVGLTTDNGIGGVSATPQSTGSQNIPLTDNAINRVWLGYLKTTDPTIFSLKKVTNERLFTSSGDGFQIKITTTDSEAGFIKIGEVTTSGGNITTINIDNVRDINVPTHSAIVPTSPAALEVTLPRIPINIPAVTRDPGGTPVVLTFAGEGVTPSTGQFVVNFTTGTLTFASDSEGFAVDIDYEALSFRRQVSQTKQVGTQITPVSLPSTYEAGLTTSFADHVAARGGGTISPTNPHGVTAADIGLAGIENIGTQLSSSGIILPTGDAGSTVSTLSPRATSSAIPSDNKVAFSPLGGNEAVNINGVIITSSNISSITEYDFVTPTSGVTGITNSAFDGSSGTYSFFIDPTLKSIIRVKGAIPATGFPLASIFWSGAQLQAPLTDLRVFGTTAAPNMRFEVLGALSVGLASGDRTSSFYHARLVGTVAAVGLDPSYNIGGQTINITIDNSIETITFPGAPASPLILQGVLDTITGWNGTNIKAIATSDLKVKLFSPETLEITGGTALTTLGLTSTPPNNIDNDGDLKNMLISGDTATLGVNNTTQDVEVDLTYDSTPERKLIQVISTIGNKTLRTDITYSSNGSIATVKETVS